jgi:DNA-binding XRE family transcriptional regulator
MVVPNGSAGTLVCLGIGMTIIEKIRKNKEGKMTIGQTIKKVRESKGYSQNKLSMKSGVSTQTIAQWEWDKNTPTVTLLWCIADALDVTIDELIGRTVLKAPCIHCEFYPPSIADGKPCLNCPAQAKE